MNIVVLAGGLSPERDVSLSSGSLIANTLRESGHHVLLLDIYEGIKQDINDFSSLFQDKNTGKPYTYKISDKAPDINAMNSLISSGAAQIGKNVLEICSCADIVFIALHGAAGENGQVQAVFNMLGIKYTGTNYTGCLLAMDKDLTKKLLRYAGISTADWITFSSKSISEEKIIEDIGFPCVIKPCSAGSSIGVSIVENREELANGLNQAKEVESEILVEKKINGREFSVGILQGKALPVIEIVPKCGFYDYTNKYQAQFTDEICPAHLTEPEFKKVQDLALRVHNILRLGTYSRIDFILDDKGEFICLEANTLPGMTPTSLLPQEALTDGISYIELCDQIVKAAQERNF